MRPEPSATPGWLLPAVVGLGAAALAMLAMTMAAPYLQLDALMTPEGLADPGERARAQLMLKRVHRMHEMAYVAIAFACACIAFALRSAGRVAEQRRRALGGR